jgi:hypothetical protein
MFSSPGELSCSSICLYVSLLDICIPISSPDPLGQLYPKLAQVPSLIELCPVVLEKKIFFKIQFFLLFCYYLPLEKGDPLHLDKLESPPPKDDLCQVWLNLAHWFWRRSRNYESLQTDGRRAIIIAYLSLQLR